MADLATLFQFVWGLVAGSGLTGLVIVRYEYRERKKEKARDYFRELVLTPDFFRFESLIWDLCKVYRTYDKMKSGETQFLVVQGSIIAIQNPDDWDKNIRALSLQSPMLMKKLGDTGVIFLAPKKIRLRVTDIALKMGQFGKRIDAGQDVSELVKEVENQLKQLSEDARGIMGILEL